MDIENQLIREFEALDLNSNAKNFIYHETNGNIIKPVYWNP